MRIGIVKTAMFLMKKLISSNKYQKKKLKLYFIPNGYKIINN